VQVLTAMDINIVFFPERSCMNWCIGTNVGALALRVRERVLQPSSGWNALSPPKNLFTLDRTNFASVTCKTLLRQHLLFLFGKHDQQNRHIE